MCSDDVAVAVGLICNYELIYIRIYYEGMEITLNSKIVRNEFQAVALAVLKLKSEPQPLK